MFIKNLIPFRKRLQTLNRVELFANRLQQNIELLTKKNEGRNLFPVLKSNAYGHGLPEIMRILSSYDFPYIAVDSYYEATQIWKEKQCPVLVLGPNLPENLRHMYWSNLSLAIANRDVLRAAIEMKDRVSIHLALNTGMNREGFQIKDLPEVLHLLQKHSHIHVDGVFSHFADADGETNSYTTLQEERFTECLDMINRAGFFPKFVHLGNSAGCLKTTDERINAVRPGIALYGFNPLLERDPKHKELSQLQPIIRLVSTVTNIQHVEPGEGVSYNCSFRAKNKMNIGVIPIGYHEALDRKLSNCGYLKYKKKFLPIVGRVCMNLTCFDTNNTDVQVGDEIIVISESTADRNSVKNIAEKTGTIPYEVLTRIDKSIRRTIR